MEEENKIAVNLYEYNVLLDIKNKYVSMMKCLFKDKNVELNYRENGLEFSVGDLITLVEYLEPEKYEDTVRKLQEIKEAKRKEKENVESIN